MTKHRILFASPVLHHPPVGGPTLRIENSIKALANIAEVTVYSRIAECAIGGAKATSFYDKISNGLVFSPHTIPGSAVGKYSKKAVNYLAKRVTGRIPFGDVYGPRKENFGDLLRVARRIKADVIWLGYGNISYPLLEYLKAESNYPVVLDTDSVWSRFVLRGLPFAKDESDRLKIEKEGKAKEEEEIRGTKLADVTTAVSEVDAAYYREFVDDPGRVMIFSNVIDIQSYQNHVEADAGLKHPNIYLAGTFWPGSPMEEAARWVMNEVLPRLRSVHPGIQFNIAGKGSREVLGAVDLPDVRILGQVESVLPFLAHADVVLVPLKYESGTRFKILEAGACKRAVVSTTLGAEGLDVTHGGNILIADDATDFVEAISRVLSDKALAQSMGESLYELVACDYSLRTLEDQGRAVLAKVLQ